VLAGTLLVALPLRQFIVGSVLSVGTGFVLKSVWSVYLFNVLAATFSVFTAVYCIKQAKAPIKSAELFGRHVPLAVFSFFAAACLCFKAIQDLIKFLDTDAAKRIAGKLGYNTPISSEGPNYTDAFKEYLLLIYVIFAILSAVAFAFYASQMLRTDSHLKQHSFFAVAPVWYLMTRLLHILLEPINFKNTPEELLEMFMLAVSMFFFMYFARVITKTNSQRSVRKLFISAVISIFLGFCSSFPRLVLLIFGRTETGENGVVFVARQIIRCQFQPADLALSAFIACFMLTVLLQKKPYAIAVEMTDTTTEVLNATD
jgi:hypothetical protein